MVKQEMIFGLFQGNYIYRHHVEPRSLKLYVLREESFPIPLRYIDVTRATSTNLDVMFERIDEYWNIEGNRDLSDSWTGFTRFSFLEEKPPDGYTWSGRRLTKKQTTSRPACFGPERHGKTCQRQRNEKKNKSWPSQNRSLTTLEDCAVFTTLIQRMQNSKKLVKHAPDACSNALQDQEKNVQGNLSQS